MNLRDLPLHNDHLGDISGFLDGGEGSLDEFFGSSDITFSPADVGHSQP